MTLRCLLLGHRRSRSRATFDEKHQRWFSECKRCCVPLVREADGSWSPGPPPADKLEPVAPAADAQDGAPPVDERSDERSGPARGGLGESPFGAPGAADSTDGGDLTAAKHPEQAV